MFLNFGIKHIEDFDDDMLLLYRISSNVISHVGMIQNFLSHGKYPSNNF